ncbi:glycoside hydrolase family 19 protein [Trinickia sp.]|uniref:glycoside hydrolase family 19 protein n=1 Tax=Trinickia sp. TaxID=2571163 RepID=UPI003F8151EE
MTTSVGPKHPSRPQPPRPDKTRLKRLSFAFPFLRNGRGKAGGSSRFTDEHEIYRLLATREPSGSYLVSKKGMWHGGVHVTENGAGQSFDLDAGVRCIADGHVIAYRINRTYPESAGTDANGRPIGVPYSTGFALVRHTMSFPSDAALTFYSLYMHLMSYEDYANFAKRQKPAYWPVQWRVTKWANDRPRAGRTGQSADPAQAGLGIRKSPRSGLPIGIVPQGASVSIGKQENGWGQITNFHGPSLHPPVAGGFVSPSEAIGGWISMGEDNGGPLVEAFMPESAFECVTIAAAFAGDPGAPDAAGIPIKAGDLVGHLGRYDSQDRPTAGTRMVHLEVFCDDSIKSFIERGRSWVDEHGARKEDWAALGLPSDPTILRVEPGTVLYQRTPNDRFVAGAEPYLAKADVVQTYSFAELERDNEKKFTEQDECRLCKLKVNWWHVESANALGQPIEGWVREFNHPGGRVTREFAQEWIDFNCIEGTHDPVHTICAAASAWIDYASSANVETPGSRSKLSPLMLAVYDTLFARGDGRQAADALCTLSKVEGEGYPWHMRAASRLIVKHESEWANPLKWKQLTTELESKTGRKPKHEEEHKRIDKLTWWDEVRAGVGGFPPPYVFHVNPVALVGNFFGREFEFTPQMMRRLFPGASVEIIQELVNEFNAHIEIYNLDSPLRRAHFFAQVMQEAGASLVLEEVFVWRADALIANFMYFKRNPQKAVEHGYEKTKGIKSNGARMTQDDFEAIANGAYGGRADLGNGDYDSGDGWRYRGRGMKQLTGRANYKGFTNWNRKYQGEWPEDVVDFEKDPDLLLQPKYAARSAAYFWVTNRLAEIADRGRASEHVDDITAVVNFNTDSYEARVSNFDLIDDWGGFN